MVGLMISYDLREITDFHGLGRNGAISPAGPESGVQRANLANAVLLSVAKACGRTGWSLRDLSNPDPTL